MEIFISYRRSDESGHAGRLYDHLEHVFSPEGVFMDVDGIPAGHSFDEVIKQRVENSKVVLAVIGGRWLTASDESGNRRLDLSDDLVRQEIAIGLTKDNRVIPILVDGTRMPRPDQLPEPLRRLASCQALEITHRRFRIDAEQIIDAIKKRLEELAGAAGGKRTWDRTTFLGAARGAPLKARLATVLEWVGAKYFLRWGRGAKYGTALIMPKGRDSTVLSIDTTGMVYLYLDDLQRLGVFTLPSDREAFVDRLNEVQGLAITKERAGQKYIGFQIGNVDREDVPQLLSKLDAEFEKIQS